MTQVELYGAPTGNCLRAAIALEEAEVPYRVRPVDLAAGQQRSPEHLALNPAGLVPVLVDGATVLTQSNAIAFYAAERAPDRLLPADGTDRSRALEHFFYFVTDVIAPSHAAFALRRLDPAYEAAAATLDGRMLAAIQAAERFVAAAPWMAGAQFTLADIAAYTIVRFAENRIAWPDVPGLDRWYRQVAARPAVQRGLRAFG